MSLLAVAEQHILESQNLTVREVIRSRILQCDHAESVADVAARMHGAGCSSIIVTRDGEPVGIWTERDSLAIDFYNPASVGRQISQVMSSPIKTVDGDIPLHEVSVRFRNDRVRHYLVLDQGRPIGVVTQTDVVMNQGIEHYLHLRSVDTAISGPPLVLEADSALGAGADLMRRERVDAALVIYPDGECGIITERDLIRLIAERRLDAPVGDSASRPLITVAPNVSLYRARNTLLEGRVRHVGVLDAGSGKVIGIVSFSDILSGIELVYVKELRQALEERNQALTVSRRNLQLADKVIESSLEGIIVTDAAQRIVNVNPAFTRMMGYEPQAVIGERPSMFSSGRHGPEFYRLMWESIGENGHWQGEIWNRRANGEVFPELLTITAITDDNGGVTHYAAVFSDISELKENEQKIRHLAYYDPLTGLPNRRLFQDRLGMAIAHAHRGGIRLALIFVDLDRFKRINDSLGHEAGDRVLKTVADRLAGVVHEDDTVARLGGDEFVVMLSDLKHEEGAVTVAQRICEAMNEPLDVGSAEYSVVTCSLGISLYPEDGLSLEELVRNADSAMYRAKDLGRNNFQLYSPEINARSLEHLAMENNLRRALEQKNLEVHYQPLVRMSDGQVAAAEALLRWNHPDLGRVDPGDFISLAEETGLIAPIGEWVLDTVCAQIEAWDRAGRPRLEVSVNISPIQFRNQDFPKQVAGVLARYAIEPSRITLELIETVLVEDAVENIRILQALRALGVGLDLDDFGTGYSSLNYLKRFPINRLKIDRVFVRDLGKSERDNAIVAAIIQLAHSLGLEVVAEGVEQAEQLEFLRQSGSDWVQGFYYGGALDAAAFAAAHWD